MLNIDTAITLSIVGFAAVYLVKKFFINKECTGCSCSGHGCGEHEHSGIKDLRSGSCKDGCVAEKKSGE